MKKLPMDYDMHLWLDEELFRFIQRFARATDRTGNGAVRHMIRRFKDELEQAQGAMDGAGEVREGAGR